MKVIDIAVGDIIINPEIATRRGGHDKDSIDLIAKSYMQRAEDGMEPIQINPGLVRQVYGKYELIDGEGRYGACLVVNEAGGIDGEPMTFKAVVARADDEAAIISGIQANFHAATDAFDRADAMSKLEALGKKQKDIAKIFGMSEGTVTQMLKLNACPKKYIQAFRDGDLEQDAVIAIADLDTSDTQRTEIFEEAVRHKQRVNDILAKKEFRDKKAAIDAEIEAAKEHEKALAEQAKEAEKKAKEADKLLAKTKDEKELAEARKVKDAADKDKKKLGTEWAKAQKAVVKAKEAKEKLAAQSPTAKKSKATAEDVKAAAKEKGVKGVTASPRTKNQFIAELEAMGEDEKSPLPKSAENLIARIEEFLDGECTAAQLSNAFKKYCVKD